MTDVAVQAGDPHDPALELTLSEPVEVIAFDIDGCLAPVGHGDLDLGSLARIQALSQAAAHDPSVPRVTVITGRPQPYVDAMLQLLHVDLPASFENGAGLCTRDPYLSWFLPEVEAGRRELARAERELAGMDDLFVQLGKSASLSIFARDPQATPVAALARRLSAWVQERSFELLVDPSSDCVNLLLPGTSKESGLRALAGATGVPERRFAGVGDSVGDAGWLRRCGVSFAPSNAMPEAREAVTHASNLPDVRCSLAAYLALVRANRTLMRGSAG